MNNQNNKGMETVEAEKRYGNDINLYGGQREGFIAGAQWAKQQSDGDKIQKGYAILKGDESPDYLAGVIDAMKAAFEPLDETDVLIWRFIKG